MYQETVAGNCDGYGKQLPVALPKYINKLQMGCTADYAVVSSGSDSSPA